MCRKAFLFRSFNHMAKLPLSNSVANKKLFRFYLNNFHPQYDVWSLKQIMNVKKIEEAKIDEFTNYWFKILRVDNKDRSVITLADLPFMNSHDWIVLYRIWKKHETKFCSHLLHITRMIRNYCMEVRNMDDEVSKSMKKNATSTISIDQHEGLEYIREGLIQKEPWGIVYKVLEEGIVRNKMLYLNDKHCYNFDCLNSVLSRSEMCKANAKNT